MAMRVDSFERDRELSSEREKLGKMLLGFCDFKFLGFVIEIVVQLRLLFHREKENKNTSKAPIIYRKI